MRDSITIGTRASKLALVQANLVRDHLMAANPGLDVRIENITTRGDIILDRPLSAIGDKGLFVTELEDAMRAGRIDLAVHSAKDLPSELPDDMALAAFPRREDARDALVSRAGLGLQELPQGAHVGTSSLRRACQLRAVRPDLRISDLRGNVDTRLRKLHEGQYDAIVLAAAGLIRLGLQSEIAELLAPGVMIPAAAQGILALETRAGDERLAALLATLDHAPSRIAALAERAFLARAGGGCQVPLAAWANVEGDHLTIAGMIGAVDGRLVRGEVHGAAAAAAALGVALAATLLAQGGRELLEETRAAGATGPGVES
jgi:hydroxymethylbilane synthase